MILDHEAERGPRRAPTTISMRRRLVGMMLGSLALVWALMLVFSQYEARYELNELADTRLEEAAQLLLRLDLQTLKSMAAEPRAEGQDGSDGPDGHDYHVGFQVWDKSGKLKLVSAGAPPAPYRNRIGFETLVIQDHKWRIYTADEVQNGHRVSVFEPEIARADLVNKIATRMAQFMLLLLPLLALLLWLSVGRAVAPLTVVSRAIALRGADRLDPLQLDRVPQELKPVVKSLNRLLERLSISIDRERSFTADAAHELRTPLAAIKVQAEVALAAHDERERRHAIGQVIAGVDNTTHLVKQLLLLARVEHSEAATIHPVNLGNLAAECAARRAGDIVARGMEIDIDVQPDCLINGNPAALSIILDNLLDNAVKYGRSKGNIAVTVRRDGDDLVLCVQDDGVGVPWDKRKRLMDRFYRGGESSAPGSGLGLSIVDKIAKVHRGEMTLGDGIGKRGLGVTLRFHSVL